MRTCVIIFMTFCLFIKCIANETSLLNEFVIELAVDENAREVIEGMGFKFIRKLHDHDYAYLAELPDKSFKNVTKHISRMRRGAEVMRVEQQRKLIRTKRDNVVWNDEKYSNMWYLNRASRNGKPDLNVQEAWHLGYSGRGVVVTIMDDGLDHTHPDLTANYDVEASKDVNQGDRDPMPNTTNPENKHGTRCAGQVAAVGNNSVCIVGVAFNAKIGGIRMLDGTITDRVEAESLRFNQNYIDIYSGSWGPDDTGLIYEGPGRLATEAFHKGATSGRNGLGNVFVWASGNGGRRGDSCAADGYVSSIYTLAVSSVTEQNSQPWYLEKCSATMVATYSSGGPGESGIVTTDLNHGCTSSHTGTSASAPLAVGIVALLLEANPQLTWRDVQYVVALTANPNPFKDGNFTKNGAGHLYSNYYGFGLMDAGKAVRLGELWRTLPPHHRCTTNIKQLSRPLSTMFSEMYVFNFTGCQQSGTEEFDGVSFRSYRKIAEEGEPVSYLEHVQVFMTVRYGHRGLVRVRVQSPSGTVSELMPIRLLDAYSDFKGLESWPLMSVQFWGEPAAGEWKITIDNKEGVDKITSWTKQKPTLDKTPGEWESVHMVAYGSEAFPVRLRPPRETRAPPAEWFQKFAHFVVADNDTQPSDYACHNQCASEKCWGPTSSQCLNGCKNYITDSGQCVADCPMGTTALISIMLKLRHRSQSVGSTEVRNNRRVDFRCERCFSTCAECLRPHAAYGCTACAGDSFLAPFLSPPQTSQLISADESAILEALSLTEMTLLRSASFYREPGLVGSCVSRCPTGYFANETSRICEQCLENCNECRGSEEYSCLKCAPNFRLLSGVCVDPTGPNKCPKDSYLQGNICVPCTTGCERGFCSDHGTCAYCDSDHRFMQEGRCEKSCAPGFFPAFLLNRKSFYETELSAPVDTNVGVWVCSACPPGCAVCSASQKLVQGYVVPRCEECDEGLVFDTQKLVCKSPCPLGKFGPNCSRSCHHMCKSCSNEMDSCLDCSPGAYLAFGEKVPNLRGPFSKLIISGYGCNVFCPESTYASRIDGERVCLGCPPLCKTCVAADRCSNCHDGFSLNELTGLCEYSATCLQEDYFDSSDQKCKPCHASCASCRGPSANDCLSCRRSRLGAAPSPACLEASPPSPEAVLASMQGAQLSAASHGSCVPCCSVEQLFDTKPPSGCFFCLPNENTCSSWAAVGGGLDPFDTYNLTSGDPSFWGNKSTVQSTPTVWGWVTSSNLRIGLFFTAVFASVIALACVIYHVVVNEVRKRHNPDYHSLFMGNGEAGSRLSQRCPDAGTSPVIRGHSISPPTNNGHLNGRVVTVRPSGDKPIAPQLKGDPDAMKTGWIDPNSSPGSSVDSSLKAPPSPPSSVKV